LKKEKGLVEREALIGISALGGVVSKSVLTSSSELSARESGTIDAWSWDIVCGEQEIYFMAHVIRMLRIIT
jgi:hypothetical protein